MMEIVMERLFPKYLLNDKNGYALAKAIIKGMEIFIQTVQSGIDTVLDVDKMPEWRLDELAREYNCLYDYNEDIETKRRWIRQANRMNAILGTPEGVRQYLLGVLDNVEILEARNMEGGHPFNFRIKGYGSYSEKTIAWVHKATEQAKNVRSVFDGLNMYLHGENGVELAACAHGQCTEIISGTLDARINE